MNKIDTSEATFHARPEDQGQIVEVSYAAVDGGIVRRTHDRSNLSTSYSYLGWDDAEGEFEPWNGSVPTGDWEACRVDEGKA